MTFTAHVPVLLNEVMAALAPHSGGRYCDATLGNGGHSQAILERSAPDGLLLGLDADPRAVSLVTERLGRWAERMTLVVANFQRIGEIVQRHRFVPLDGILLDLGYSSTQMGDPSRGLSFMQEGPLDMRYSPAQTTTAGDLLNTLGEKDLADLIWQYGEDRQSRRIARAIVARRPLHSTLELAQLVQRTVGRREKIHPATRLFQALRIAVNDELTVLAQALEQLPELLTAGGTMAIISFQSLEDRVVKEFMGREAAGCLCPPEALICTCGHRPRLKLMPRKPVVPSEEEIATNPRARSAKLRVARRLEVE